MPAVSKRTKTPTNPIEPVTPNSPRTLHVLNNRVQQHKVSPTKALTKMVKGFKRSHAECTRLESELARLNAKNEVERAMRVGSRRTGFVYDQKLHDQLLEGMQFKAASDELDRAEGGGNESISYPEGFIFDQAVHEYYLKDLSEHRAADKEGQEQRDKRKRTTEKRAALRKEREQEERRSASPKQKGKGRAMETRSRSQRKSAEHES